MSNAIRASLLIYDIPEKSNLANPSPFLRRIAFRANLSCWVIPTHMIPYNRMNTLAEGGATWHVVQFDTTEAEKLTKMAHEAIARDMRLALARARRSMQTAANAYENPEDGETPTIANFEERVERAVRRAEAVLEDLKHAAGVFDIDPTTTPVQWAVQQASLIRSAAHERAKAYAEAAVQVRAIGSSDATAVANAADADSIPVGALADVIDENGGDASELRKAFADELAAV